MQTRITNRRAVLAIVSVLAMLMAVLIAAPASAHGSECDRDHVRRYDTTWKVYPNGVDDTANVECALAEASHYDGAVVRLGKGTFHLDFLVSEGFDGTLRGAGRDYTTIEPLAGGLDCKAEFEQTGNVGWLAFFDSNLRLRDFSVDIPDPACREPWDEFLEEDPETGEVFGASFQDFEFIFVNATRSPAASDVCGVTGYGSLDAKRINVHATQPDFFAPIFNPTGAFAAFVVAGTNPQNCTEFDEFVGTVSVKHVHTDGVGSMLAAQAMRDSTVRVARNTAVAVDTPVILANNENSKMWVHHNTFEGVTGVGVVADNCTGPDACLEGPTYLLVHHNQIHMDEIAFAGIGVFDGFFAPPQMQVLLAKNHIENNGNLTGIFLEDNLGTWTVRNTISGLSVFGVMAEGVTTMSKIIANDLRDLEVFEAGILLGEATSMNKVKRNYGASVLDLGTDNYVDDGLIVIPDAPTSLMRTSATPATGVDRYGAYWQHR
jgi:hypothetical protein